MDEMTLKALADKVNIATENMDGPMGDYWRGQRDGMIGALHLIGLVPVFDGDKVVGFDAL